jgi:group I intron endonuclease
VYQSGIYQIINIENNHSYIGSAKKLLLRFWMHKDELKKEKHHSVYLQRAWNKYGSEKFEFKVLCYCSVENLLFYEQRFLDAIKPEYNICKIAGSCIGIIRREESKQKQRIAMTGRKQTPEHIENARITRIGKKHTPERIEKVRLANIGKVRSEETKLKISLAKTGCIGSNTGRKLSEEWRKNIGLARKGRSTKKKGTKQLATTGEGNASAKLTEQQAICLLTTDSILTYKEAVEKYNVTKACIKDLWQRRSWAHLNYPKVIKEDDPVKRSGENHPFGKLKEAEAIAILTTDKLLTVQECAEKYHVTRIVIEQLRRRKTWKHLDLPEVNTKSTVKCTGTKNGSSKLNEDDVRDIRKRLENKESCISIGKLYGVSNVTISNIRDKKIWTHVI